LDLQVPGAFNRFNDSKSKFHCGLIYDLPSRAGPGKASRPGFPVFFITKEGVFEVKKRGYNFPTEIFPGNSGYSKIW
jgi:hypothetical protein